MRRGGQDPVRRGVETFWEFMYGEQGSQGLRSKCAGSSWRECGDVMDGEQGFGEFEDCEESMCREFQ